MMAMVIKDLRCHRMSGGNAAVVYYYCNFHRQHDQKVDQILATLIRQLFQGLSQIPDKVQGLYEKNHTAGTTLSREGSKEALLLLLREYDQVARKR